MRTIRIFCLAAALALPGLAMQAAHLENAVIEVAGSVDDLDAFVEHRAAASGRAEWLGYEVPSIDPEARICCNELWNGRPREKTCSLEGPRRGFTIHSGDSRQRRQPLADEDLLILIRLEEGRVDRVRVYSTGCPIDASGHTLTWLDAVDSDWSAALLHRIAEGEFARARSEDVRENALVGLALHATDYPDGALEAIARGSSPESLREEAIFWLGEARGRPGYLALVRLMGTLEESELREEIAFALSLSEVPEALDTLIEMARTDSDADSRGQALFWLSHAGGPRAAESILAAARDDVSADVREEAIFALSQLPGNEGTRMLIAVARDASFPREARREAIFWLGQSNDPEALDLFQEILR